MSFSRTCLFIIALIATQTTQAAPYIVKLKDTVSVWAFEAQNNVRLKEISQDMGLYEAEPLNSRSLMKASSLSAKSGVAYAIPNHTVSLRIAPQPTLPNDPLLSQQWSLQLSQNAIGIGATQTWPEFGPGGRDKSNNEIVIAIVDGGFDYNHTDLLSNRWRNRAEVFGNGKDDDGNGYIDDVYGWNAKDNNNRIGMEDHGTMVAGIIGARGDNKRGISGIHQKIKIMYVSAGGGLGDTATTMRAYTYILKQKKLWLESQGKKGANVVAINSSFGIDGAKCSLPEFTIWNDMINSLGKVGILSVGATANASIDVDKDGDIPTSCESPYLIAVTNSRVDGSKYPMAGFGFKHIDLAAPGDEILSTAQRLPNSSEPQYDVSVGTSFSAPHVTGSIGYLHSVASIEFNKLYMSNPSAGALELKRVILATVTPVNSLKSLTVSGGVMNLYEASSQMSQLNKLLAHNSP